MLPWAGIVNLQSYFKVNLPTSCSSASDCADNSSLVAEDCCAAAELFWMTSEICSIPDSSCFIASAWDSDNSLISLVDSAREAIPLMTDSIATVALDTISFPFSISRSEFSIRFFVSTAEAALSEASLPIWSATTANPFPASPALAASMEAFSDSRFVCEAISSMAEIILAISLEVSLMRL